MEKAIKSIMNEGFDRAIQNLMRPDLHEILVKRALDGDQAAQARYLETFFEVVRGIDKDFYEILLRKVVILGPDRGVEDFFEVVRDAVFSFKEVLFNRLYHHIRQGLPTMEEPLEVELEDGDLEDRLLFRFWAAGDGTEPVAEFTCMNSEDRPDHVLSAMEGLVVVEYTNYIRQLVEDTLEYLCEEVEE